MENEQNKEQTEHQEIKRPSTKKHNMVIGVLVMVVLVLVIVLLVDQPSSSEEPVEGVVEGVIIDEPLVDQGEFIADEVEVAEDGSIQKQTFKAADGDADAATTRDQQRYADVTAIRTALEAFEADKGNYPEKLEELVPDFLSAVPVDPLGDEASVPYTYTPIGSLPAGFYDFAYYMEVGVEGLEPIEHDATPDHITIMQEL